MKITLERKNDAVHLVAHNAEGNTLVMDGAESIGGENAGFRPMQVLLAALAGCASMDLVPILKKKRQELQSLRVEISGERAEGKTPAPFTSIHLHFVMQGEIEDKQAARAVELSVEKFCSVKESLNPDIVVTHSYSLNEVASSNEGT
ncbi:MAG: OsmC family peroxiredoxin [Spirochaetaceae bacterium]|nr:MAG: OsmC family peroxiredoxin [Spirochaetaceae bacterium]